MRTFKRIPQSDHNYTFIVEIDGSKFMLDFVYSNTSGGYVGTSLTGFISTLRGLLRLIPEFIETFDESNPVKSLKDLGFQEVDATETEFKMYAR